MQQGRAKPISWPQDNSNQVDLSELEGLPKSSSSSSIRIELSFNVVLRLARVLLAF